MDEPGQAFIDLKQSIAKLKRSIQITIAVSLFWGGFVVGLLVGLIIGGK